jgi:hypothetical protein
MPALGHKRTFCSAIAMTALPPKADIRRREWNARFVPGADIAEHHEALWVIAPFWRLANDAEIFRFSAEGCGLEPFGRQAAL